MKRVLSVLVFIGMPFCALALPLGDCYPRTDALARLAAEGHRVNAKTGDDKVVLTTNPQGTGYVLEAKSGGDLCVVSILARVGSLSTASTSVEVCENSNKYPEAIAVCNQLKSQALRPRRVVSAESSRSALSNKMVGPVVTNIQVCRDQTGGEIICGRTETLK
jgi:hypothetical protein